MPLWRPRALGPLSKRTKREERSGLFTLARPKDESEIALDIVAVHGLLEGALDAWKEGETSWLADPDYLPKDIPSARIMMYGYDSRVALSQSVAGVDQFAEMLLNYLEQERRNESEKHRPLLFICHSLGGIVVKTVWIYYNLFIVSISVGRTRII